MESIVNVKDFSFSYKNKKPIIQNLSFSLKKGEMLLLCGETAAGRAHFFVLSKKRLPRRVKKAAK